MFYMFSAFDFILLIPAVILAIWAQMRVSSTYTKYKKVASAQGITGAKAAEYLLNQNGLFDVKIESIEGQLSDHYDPRSKILRLSLDNYRGHSLAAIAVAAHEVGHAIQHHTAYTPLQIRHAILPVVNFGSGAALPLFLIGLFIPSLKILMDIGIIFFAGVVLFHFVTLPVEFNASNRALKQLASRGMLLEQEVSGARKVLSAAALTYVAAAAVALIHLIRLLLIRGRD
jgi:Zn-dependent membrane protease YugP